MALDKRILGVTPNPPPGFAATQEEMAQNVLDIQVQEGLDPNVELMEDGSAIIGDQTEEIPTTFDMNLAEVWKDSELGIIANDLKESFEEDKASRKEWEEFWLTVDALKVWSWEKKYVKRGICDGTEWE